MSTQSRRQVVGAHAPRDQYFPKGTRVLEKRRVGGLEPGKEGGHGSIEVKMGVTWTEKEFLEEAKKLRQVFDVKDETSDIARKLSI